jgi:hypothetical protein
MANTQSLTKAVVLLVLTFLAWVVVYEYVDFLAGQALMGIIPRIYAGLILSAVIGAIAAGALVGYPLAVLFRSSAWVAGLAIAVPFMLSRLNGILLVADEGQHEVMATIELFLYPTATTLAAAFFWTRHQREAWA